MRSSTPAHDQVEHPRLDGDVEGGRGLVADQQRGVVGQGDAPARPAAAGRRRTGAGTPARRRAGSGSRPGRAARRPRPGPTRRSGRSRGPACASATCRPTRIVGFSAVIGSWKTIATSRPRTSDSVRSLAPDAGRASTPASRTDPLARQPLGQQAHDASAVSDLPEPDSPIRPDPLAGADPEVDVGDERASPCAVTARPSTVSDVVERPSRSRAGGPVGGAYGRHRRSSSLRVEAVAQPVAEQVEPEHRDRDREAREHREAGSGEQQLLALLQHPAPRRGGRRGAEAEERQRRLGQHRDGEADRGLHDDQAARRWAGRAGARSRTASGRRPGPPGRTRCRSPAACRCATSRAKLGMVAMPMATIAISVLAP